jgi:hypothetical protein
VESAGIEALTVEESQEAAHWSVLGRHLWSRPAMIVMIDYPWPGSRECGTSWDIEVLPAAPRRQSVVLMDAGDAGRGWSRAVFHR